MNQKFIIVLKCTHGLYLQIIKTLCLVRLRYLESNFRLKYFLSLWSWGLVGTSLGHKRNASH